MADPTPTTPPASDQLPSPAEEALPWLEELRLEPPQHPVTAPVLRELDGRPRQVAREALQLLLELLVQRERVGRAAGEPGDDLVPLEEPDLLRVRLHHGVAHRDLAVAAHGEPAVLADAQDGGGVDRLHVMPSGAPGGRPS